MDPIPVFRPDYGPREIEAVTEVLKSGWIGLGPKTAEFETKFADYLGAKYAVGVNSATAALHLAMVLADVEGREVITTPNTFVSTNHAILYCGGTPVFADIEPDTLNIDPASIEKRITKKTRAIVVVHYGGHACRMDRIVALARKHKLVVIEDSAHGCGGKFKDKMLGTIGDYGCFSFHAVKNLAMGEGGAIVCKRKGEYERLRRLRWLGINKGTWDRAKSTSYAWEYDVPELGYKCHLHDISAALGLVQLDRLEDLNGRRRALWERYNEKLDGIEGLDTPVVRDYAFDACHNYVVKYDDRDGLHSFLKERNISTGVHYIPNNLYDMYKDCKGPTPVCHDVWTRLLTLPLFPTLTRRDQDRVISAIREYAKTRA